MLDIIVSTLDVAKAVNYPISQWMDFADSKAHRLHITKNTGIGPVATYQEVFSSLPSDSEIQAYIHDDVIIREKGWDTRILKLFQDPKIGVVGFGGGRGHGTDDIYKAPYQIWQLQRIGYMSNVDDAEVHGVRFDGDTEVAVLDGFCLVVRKQLLEQAGGWPIEHLIFHCYDYWLTCMAHRLGYEVWMTGVKCYHMGGQTSTKAEYNDWLKKTHGIDDAEVHRSSHVYIYKEFKDVLPWRVRFPR